MAGVGEKFRAYGLPDTEVQGNWDVSVEIDDVKLAGASALQPSEAARFDSGKGDIELSLAYANEAIQSATADIDFENISVISMKANAARSSCPQNWLSMLAVELFQCRIRQIERNSRRIFNRECQWLRRRIAHDEL